MMYFFRPFVPTLCLGLALVLAAPPASADTTDKKAKDAAKADAPDKNGGKDKKKKSRSKPAPLTFSGQYGDTTIAVNGQVGRPLIGKDIEVDIEANGKNLARLATLMGLRMKAMGPYEFSARMKDSRDGLTLLGIKLKMGSSSMRGSLRFKYLEDRLSVFGKIEAERLVLDEVWPEFRRAAGADREEEEEDERKLFSDSKLPLDDLRAADVRISLNADTLVLPGIELTEVSATISVKDGTFTLRNGTAQMGSGKVDLSLEYDAGNPKRRPTLAVEGTVQNLATHEFLDRVGLPAFVKGAPISGVYELDSEGDDMTELLSRLSGQVMLALGKGEFDNNAIKATGMNPMRQLYETVNPKAAEDATTPFECAIINLPISRGGAQVNQLLGLEAKSFKLLAGGRIAFGKEDLDLGMLSDGRGGDDVIAHLGGSFQFPNVRFGPYEGTKGSLKLGDGSSTRGLGDLRNGLRAQEKEGTTPCATVKKTAGDDNKKQKRPKRADGGTKSSGTKKSNPVDKAISGVKNLFR